MHSLRDFNPHSSDNKFRIQRFRLFKTIVDEILSQKSHCRVLDIGGTPEYWNSFGNELDLERVQISVLNLTMPKMAPSKFIALVGDARNISRWEDFSFDVVHSNSVIEHVGRWAEMTAMAKEVRQTCRPIFCPDAIFLVSYRATCAVSSSSLDAEIMALSHHDEARLWFLAKTSECRRCDKCHSKCTPTRQEAVSVLVS